MVPVVVLVHGLGAGVTRQRLVEALAPGLLGGGGAGGAVVLAADQRGVGGSTTRKQRARWWRWQPGAGGWHIEHRQ
eukprot:COSAG01_NODE_1152_length_11492_cov_12.314842_14_plen_76_part_00